MVTIIVKNIYKSFFLGLGTALATSASFALVNPDASKNQSIKSSHQPIQLAQADIDDDNLNFESDKDIITRDSSPSTRGKFISYKIKPGESLSTIFTDLSLKQDDLNKILRHPKFGHQFAELEAGKILNFKLNAHNVVTEIAYRLDDTQMIVVSPNRNDISITASDIPVVKRYATAHVVLDSSLDRAAKNAGLPANLTSKLAEIFAWDIDFAQNLRSNDQFTVVYEQLLIDKKIVGTGDIIAAEFINQGESHQAVRYIDHEGNVGYYTPRGENLRKAFLGAPLDYGRISSYFSPRRNHPILNRIRAHTGVDYAASTGTPIRATGDGRISFQGVKGGYGRVVTVDHGHGYTTLYAHMSRFETAFQEGDTVKQGQVIGFVGRSGLATGPHLHYEFLVDGVHKNPLTVQASLSMPIDRSLLSHFKVQTRPYLAQLDQAKSTMLARNNLRED